MPFLTVYKHNVHTFCTAELYTRIQAPAVGFSTSSTYPQCDPFMWADPLKLLTDWSPASRGPIGFETKFCILPSHKPGLVRYHSHDLSLSLYTRPPSALRAPLTKIATSLLRRRNYSLPSILYSPTKVLARSEASKKRILVGSVGGQTTVRM